MVSTNDRQKTRVAILIENNFEDSEFQIPYTALQQAGAEISILGSRMNDEYKGKRGIVTIKPTATATEVRAEDFDAIIIPGGNAPDKIRANPNAVRLVTDAIDEGKLVAAVCHGPQVLIEADRLRDKQATGFQAIRKDIQNAGANYIDEPVVVETNLITSRQPGDLPVFTTTILTRLHLNIENTVLPDRSDSTYEWWRLGEAWGGSSRDEIVNAINTAIAGESYTLKAFELYVDKASDPEIRTMLEEVCILKRQHIKRLETRLTAFEEGVTWQEAGGAAIATLQSWIESSDNMDILRRALGNLQTGVVDSYHLCGQLTDPLTVAILTDIEKNLSLLEQRVGDLYRARVGKNVKPPMPTTMAAVA
ncbi:DJ-1/PfpI/YhbO family deglycase/protease [Pleurocapsales cyanobacterium LEGE 06147]|nr:DJ-1/PfpI/YhbO family deglycase/protease [Pleurocapsales cyanobacterium LEGE 06147]